MERLQYLLQITGITLLVITLANAVAVNNITSSSSSSSSSSSAATSLLTLTSDRRLALPVGTLIVLTSTISVPLDLGLAVGNSPVFTSSMPFKVDCDELGLTSPENTWGHFIKKREVTPSKGNLAGGDREVMYRLVERILGSSGLDGKACLLRAICEMPLEPLDNYGFLGEILEIFLSPSRKHSNSERLSEYTEAQIHGETAGNCKKYEKKCNYSFFVPSSKNKNV